MTTPFGALIGSEVVGALPDGSGGGANVVVVEVVVVAGSGSHENAILVGHIVVPVLSMHCSPHQPQVTRSVQSEQRVRRTQGVTERAGMVTDVPA